MSAAVYHRPQRVRGPVRVGGGMRHDMPLGAKALLSALVAALVGVSASAARQQPTPDIGSTINAWVVTVTYEFEIDDSFTTTAGEEIRIVATETMTWTVRDEAASQVYKAEPGGVESWEVVADFEINGTFHLE